MSVHIPFAFDLLSFMVGAFMNSSSSLEESLLLSWLCARTQPKHEHIAAANLRKQLGLQVFHPRIKVERATRRGLVRSVEPLFPCYIFVRCTLQEHSSLIRYVPGVSSLVQFGGIVPEVPSNVVEELQQCFSSDEPLFLQDRIGEGDEVSVVEGALMGSRGIVARVMPARQRVQILLDFLGRTTLVEFDRSSLQVENRSLADLMPSLAQEQLDCSLGL